MTMKQLVAARFWVLCFFVALSFMLFSACEKKEEMPVPQMSLSEDLPQCQIEAAKSCEAEFTSETETVYRCPTCRTVGQCPDCKDHDCKKCSDQPCRCRLTKPVNP